MRSKQKSRRGSTLVLVALMLGAFRGIAAIASDIGIPGRSWSSWDGGQRSGLEALVRLLASHRRR